MGIRWEGEAAPPRDSHLIPEPHRQLLPVFVSPAPNSHPLGRGSCGFPKPMGMGEGMIPPWLNAGLLTGSAPARSARPAAGLFSPA